MFVKNRNKTVGLCVMVVTACLVLATLWTVLATPETALAKKPDGSKGGGKNLHLSVTFRDGVGDRVTSDGIGGGKYSDGEDKVIALAYKLFRFDTTRGASSHKGGKRTVTLNFSHASEDVKSIFGTDDVSVPVDMRLGFKYPDGGATGDFLEELDVSGMGEGDAIQAAMSIHFEYNGEPYGLAFGHIAQFIDEIRVNTGRPVTVTRTEEDTWTIEATSDDDQAALYLLDWKNGPNHYGNIAMPFKVTLVVQP